MSELSFYLLQITQAESRRTGSLPSRTTTAIRFSQIKEGFLYDADLHQLLTSLKNMAIAQSPQNPGDHPAAIAAQLLVDYQGYPSVREYFATNPEKTRSGRKVSTRNR